MDPTVWGPPMWRLFSDVAYYATAENFRDVKLFFESMKFLLPCRFCRDAYMFFLEKLDPNEVKTPDDMIFWLYNVHEHVNDKLEKLDRISPDDYVKRIEILLTLSSEEDFFTVLFLLAMNYDNNTHPDKQVWMQTFCAILPNVICTIPNRSGEALLENYFVVDKPLSSMALFEAVYRTYRVAEPTDESVEDVWERLEKIKSHKKTEQVCGTVP